MIGGGFGGAERVECDRASHMPLCGQNTGVHPHRNRIKHCWCKSPSPHLDEIGGLVRNADAGGADGDADADEGGEPLHDEEDVGGGVVVEGDHLWGVQVICDGSD